MADGTEELIEEMFVQVATGVSGSDAELVLHGVSPSTLYFSDRPQRVVGHLTTQQFVAQWGEGDNSFAADPPNAVVSTFSNDDETPSEAVVVLRDPALSDDTLTYRVEVLEGALPVTAGACTVFIDPLGRPLSPGSIMGVRRRQGRRARRQF